MAKQRQLDISLPDLDGLSSYAELTADAILKSYGVNFSKADITSQVKTEHSFYKLLIGLMAQYLYTQLLLNRCTELQEICQNEFISIKLYQLQHNDPDENLQPLSTDLEKEIKEEEKNLLRIEELIKDINSQTTKDLEDIKKNMHEFIQQWLQVQQDNTDNLAQKIKQQGFTLPDNFEKKLFRNLNKFAADVDFTQEQLKSFKLKQQPNPVEKAVIASLIES